MVIVVDGVRGAVELTDPDDCRRFHVEVRGLATESELESVLEMAGAGTIDGADALIGVAWVRSRAEGRVAHDWEERFAQMLAFAAAKGWLRSGGASVQAHVVWG